MKSADKIIAVLTDDDPVEEVTELKELLAEARKEIVKWVDGCLGHEAEELDIIKKIDDILDEN